jgi:hypothetical protein
LALNPSIVDDIPYTLNDVKMDEVLYANHWMNIELQI